MKISVVLVVMLVLVAIVATAGCGGDKDKAIDYINKANSFAPTMIEATDFNKKLESMYNDLVSEKITSKQAYDFRKNELESSFKNVKDKMERLKAEYNEISKLKDVEEYKRFAGQTIEKADIDSERVKSTLVVMDKIAASIFSSSGQPDQKTRDELKHLNDELQKLSKKRNDLDKQVKELGKKLGLKFQSAE